MLSEDTEEPLRDKVCWLPDGRGGCNSVALKPEALELTLSWSHSAPSSVKQCHLGPDPLSSSDRSVHLLSLVTLPGNWSKAGNPQQS